MLELFDTTHLSGDSTKGGEAKKIFWDHLFLGRAQYFRTQIISGVALGP
jgi:hypothetical protein